MQLTVLIARKASANLTSESSRWPNSAWRTGVLHNKASDVEQATESITFCFKQGGGGKKGGNAAHCAARSQSER